MRGKLVHELKLHVRVRVSGWVRVMVEFGTSSAFRGWVRVRVLGYGSGVSGRKVKSRDCALASDLVRAVSAKPLVSIFTSHYFSNSPPCSMMKHLTSNMTCNTVASLTRD